MSNVEFKNKLEDMEVRYQDKIDNLKEKGLKRFVDWKVIRKLKVYLNGKGVNTNVSLMEYNDFYSCIVFEAFDLVNGEEVPVSVIIVTPEDTGGSAYGKAERILVVDYNKYLEEKENNLNG